MKKLIVTFMMLAGLWSVAIAADANSTAPKSVIHVVTVSWKEGTTPEQIQAAIDGAKALPSKFPGITRVWTRVVKNQTNMQNIIVMEFASEDELKKYAGSDAQKEWYKVYLPIRKESRTSDISN
jgi:uncharacterized protein (DUF1330 family)